MSREDTETKGWNRQAVTYRLSARRREDLRALCGAELLSPTAALDVAIALAKEAKQRENSSTKLSEILDHVSKTSRRSDGILATMASQIEELRSTILAVANSDESDMNEHLRTNSTEKAALTMGAWLEQEALRLPSQAFVVKAQWMVTKRGANESMQLDMLVQRSMGTHQHQKRKSEPSLVCVTIPASHIAISQVANLRMFYFKCHRKDKNDWQISIYQDTGGQLGSPFTLRV